MSEQHPPVKLYKKLHKIKAALGSSVTDRTHKSKKSDGSSFNSLTNHIYKEWGLESLKNKVDLHPGSRRTEANNEGNTQSIAYDMTFVDIETGETITYPWTQTLFLSPHGKLDLFADNRAHSDAIKHFICHFFQVPVIDEPDLERQQPQGATTVISDEDRGILRDRFLDQAVTQIDNLNSAEEAINILQQAKVGQFDPTQKERYLAILRAHTVIPDAPLSSDEEYNEPENLNEMVEKNPTPPEPVLSYCCPLAEVPQEVQDMLVDEFNKYVEDKIDFAKLLEFWKQQDKVPKNYEPSMHDKFIEFISLIAKMTQFKTDAEAIMPDEDFEGIKTFLATRGWSNNRVAVAVTREDNVKPILKVLHDEMAFRIQQKNTPKIEAGDNNEIIEHNTNPSEVFTEVEDDPFSKDAEAIAKCLVR